ncbi:MAG TPA: MFS transporter [Tepidisphaeraceae bacterium]|jgi:ACS family tartrate transporter-like MFS transporter|nr:MFS transporter [Tepidisphaeraceae bacterium]
MTEVLEGVDARVARKVLWRLMPFLCLLFIVNYLDRTNVAMAKLRMSGDVGLSETIYGLGTGLFFIGYFIFEVPSNLIMERVGARRWIARIMLSWGVVSAGMMFVRGPASFGALRFLLGAAEAGFFPGIVLFLTYWVPARRRAAVMAWFLTSTATSGIIGNPLAGALMKLDGARGLHGWQWLFLVEGALPVVMGVVVWKILPDRPAEARWLSAEEAAWINEELRGERQEHPGHVAELRAAIRDGRLWLLSGIYFMIIMGLYGFVYWVPTIIKSVSPGVTDVKIGLLAAIPYVVGAVTMVVVGKHSDHTEERRWHVAACCAIAAAGVMMVAWGTSHGFVMGALCVAAVGIFGSLGPFWALATHFLRGSAAAGGIAIVNSIGALAGFVAPFVIGWAKDATGRFTGGLLVVAGALVCGAALVLMVGEYGRS